MDIIKPCGHCGQEAVFFNDFKDAGRVICTNCGCSSPLSCRETAIRVWNRREESCLGCAHEEEGHYHCNYCIRLETECIDYWTPKEVG